MKAFFDTLSEQVLLHRDLLETLDWLLAHQPPIQLPLAAGNFALTREGFRYADAEGFQLGPVPYGECSVADLESYIGWLTGDDQPELLPPHSTALYSRTPTQAGEIRRLTLNLGLSRSERIQALLQLNNLSAAQAAALINRLNELIAGVPLAA